jgi:hypothetical protein
VSYDQKTGHLTFTARFSIGDVRDVFTFDGRLTTTEVTGTLKRRWGRMRGRHKRADHAQETTGGEALIGASSYPSLARLGEDLWAADAVIGTDVPGWWAMESAFAGM